MSEADLLYANIIDMGLRSELAAQEIELKAIELRDEGRLDVAKALIEVALRGSSFMPNIKQRLREFAEDELEPDPEAD